MVIIDIASVMLVVTIREASENRHFRHKLWKMKSERS